MVTPEPGMYHGISHNEYHSWSAISNTLLGELARSPAHLKHAIECPPRATPSMITGQAIHASILEPEQFLTEYIAAPIVDKRTKDGKAAWAEFEKLADGKTILSVDDHGLCVAVHDSAVKHPAAKAILDAKGETEVSAVWVDPNTDVVCRCRADDCIDPNIIVDLKTARNGSPQGFKRAIGEYGYYRQAAFYLDGMSGATGKNYDTFLFLVVEKTPPYAVACYRLDDQSIEIGRREYTQLLELYERCLQEDYWPSYTDVVVDISVPGWVIAIDEVNILEAANANQ